MKPTRAVLAAVAAAERDGRVASSVSVNPAALAGDATPFQELSGESEKEFQKRVVAFARDRGWRIAHFRKVRVQRKNGQVYWETPVAEDGVGFPDLVMLRGDRGVAVELKVGKNSATSEQVDWLVRFKDAGFVGRVWRPEDFQEIERVLS